MKTKEKIFDKLSFRELDFDELYFLYQLECFTGSDQRAQISVGPMLEHL